MITLQQMIDEPANKIHFWRTSTDVIAPSSSPHSYKGTARHLLIAGGHKNAKEHCPRCNDVWGKASNGVRPCLTRGCHTWIEADYAQVGWKFTPIEEDIVFSEFEEDMHEAIRNDINTWADMIEDSPPPMDETPSPHHIKQFVSLDYHDSWKPFDEFVQTEEGAMLYKKALSDTQSRATVKVNNPSSLGIDMSDPRDIESDLPPPMFASEDTPPPMVDDTPPPMEATHSPQDTNKNKEEKT